MEEMKEGTKDILAQILSKLEGITRVERKLDAATSNFTTELDIVKAEIAGISEGRKEDKKSLVKLDKSIRKIGDEVTDNTNLTRALEVRIGNIDNAANKNQERISKLEESMRIMTNKTDLNDKKLID